MDWLSRAFRMDGAWCVLLCLSSVGAVHGAEAPPAASPPATVTPPGEALEELDEVVVRGNRLSRAISDAEDEFFALFNKLNTDDDYDTSCAYLNTDSGNRGSHLTSRMCIPGFVADAMVDLAVFKARCEPELSNFDTNRDHRISEWEAGASPDLVYQFADLDTDSNGVLDESEFRPWASQVAVSSNCYHPPPPEALLVERSQAWFDHSMKVINSDPRLQKMAGHLDDLYRELAEVQHRFGAIKDGQKAPPTARRERGPRKP
jgi:hypothetical protein